MRDHFAVDVRGELVSQREQLRAKLLVVLDNSVVHDLHRSGAVGVRVGVSLRNASVGGPPGVANADAGEVGLWKCRQPFRDFRYPVGAAQTENRAAMGKDGEAHGVVTAILEGLERRAKKLGSRVIRAARDDS